MKAVSGIILVLAIVSASTVSAKLQCKLPSGKVPTDWVTMESPCIKLMKDQVQVELGAAMTYLAMGAHFSRDVINRPGFAKLFFESASEEREHALKIISYLLMRGELTSDIAKLIDNPIPKETTWEKGTDALKSALELETQVTKNIREIIKMCETPSNGGANDYHLVDHLTGDFLEEQYHGQRDLAGKLSTLSKMMDSSDGGLGEFLFDKKLLNGEV